MNALVPAHQLPSLRIDRRLALLETPGGSVQAGKSVAVVLSAYRSGLIDDAKAFLRLAIPALEDFPGVVLEDLCNPKIGIVRDCTFPPSIAELVKWCDRRRSERLLENGKFRDEAEFHEFWRAYQAREPWAVEFSKREIRSIRP